VLPFPQPQWMEEAIARAEREAAAAKEAVEAAKKACAEKEEPMDLIPANKFPSTRLPQYAYEVLQEERLVWSFDNRGLEWRWHNTVSFWIASSFIIGSLFFIIGASASILRPHITKMDVHFLSRGPTSANEWEWEWKETVLVEYAYLIGGTYYTVGAYLGWFHVLNQHVPVDRVFWAARDSSVSVAAYWGALSYFVGALAFQIATVVAVAVPNSSHLVTVFLEWLPQAFGGLCFAVAAAIELHHNQHATWRERVFWVCVLYLFGSVLFSVAACTGLAMSALHVQSEELTLWAIDSAYWVGSVSFLAGAWVQLIMWKSEQFGLGFLSEMNRAFASSTVTVWDTGQQLAFMLYFTYATLAVLNIALAVHWNGRLATADATSGIQRLMEAGDVVSSCISFVASHSLLLLGTVVHATPSLHPFDYLLQLMRGVSALLCINEMITFIKLVLEVPAC